MSSQRTFQSILGKFTDGVEILKGVPGYNPSKKELQITSLEELKANAERVNSGAVSAGTRLQDLRNQRAYISFHAKGNDVNCLENLIRNIASYIKAELEAKSPAYAKIAAMLKKIKPQQEKKQELKEGEEPKKSKSQSEKSFRSLAGFGSDVYTIISNLGTAYNPSNTNISLANFKARVDELTALNSAIVKAESDYDSAVKERYEVYYGEVGISSIIPSVKDYLASFEGGKKNAAYEAYVNSMK